MQNTFGNESFLDEIAAATGVDPFEIRTRHLNDPRGLELLERLRKLAKWEPRGSRPRDAGAIARGRGVSYAKYELVRTYVAIVADVTVDRTTGAIKVDRVFVVHDCGQIINPDGLRNQIEGNVVQTVSRSAGREGDVQPQRGHQPQLGKLPDPDVSQCARGRHRPDRPAQRSSLGCGRADDIRRALGDRECGVRRDRRAGAIGAVQARPGAGGIEARKARIAGGNPCRHQTTELKATSRPPFAGRTWRFTAARTKSWRSQRRARAARSLVAGLSVAVLLAIWIAFFFFIFLPRGDVG